MNKDKGVLFSMASIVFVLFFVFSINGQNLLVIQDKMGNKDEVLRVGKKIKIITKNEEKLKGKITEIKDNSLVIYKNEETVIPLNNIQFLYAKKSNGWKTGVGVFLAISSIDIGMLVAIGISSAVKTKKEPPGTKTNDNPMVGFAVVGAIGLPPLITGSYYALFHKKKYDVQNEYNLWVVQID